jgi:DNA-binding NarL/FixJ family response regulator
MVAVAIFSADPVLRRNLEQLPRNDPALVIVGMVDQPLSVRELVNRNLIDVLLVDAPTRELLAEYRAGRDRIALVVLLDGANAEDTARALSAGARAVLDRSASRNEIIAAIKAAIAGLVVVPANILVIPEAPLADDLLKADGSGHARLTRRELEYLPRWQTVLRTKRSPVG